MTDKFEPLARIYKRGGDVEDLEGYEEGGYHPIHIGEELNCGRYKVVHKLGFGSYSTVWLVQDQQRDQLAALKIATADVSTERTESEVLRRLGNAREAVGDARGHPGMNFVPRVLDEFEIQGPNGTHQCIALEPLGPSLTFAFDYLPGFRLPPDVSRKVSIQLAQGLSYLHSCGIVHGDLYDGNIVFSLPGLSQWTAEQVYSCFGEPRKDDVIRLDGQPPGPRAPEYVIRPPLPRKLLSLCLADPSIRIIDFGEALPDRWWSQWKKRADYFAEDGTGYAGDKRASKMDMQARLKALDRNPPDGLQPEEIAAFEHILLAMLRFEADKRISAEEVVQLLPGACGTGGSSA